MYFLGKEHTNGSPRRVYQAVFQNLPLYFNYNSHLFTFFRVHYLQAPLSGMKYRSETDIQKVFLSLRETPWDCKITENTPNHQIVYQFFVKIKKTIDFIKQLFSKYDNLLQNHAYVSAV